MTEIPEEFATPYTSIVLREGDIVNVAFPGAPELDIAQQVRRDGKLVVPLAGEVDAAGKSPTELERDLIELCGPQLQVKEIRVTIAASGYPVFVTGAVLRPGKLMATRPLSVLEAIMEAGGVDYARANIKRVRVIREKDGETETYTLNLKDTIEGKQRVVFYLRPSDIVYVPEKFSLF